MLRIVLLTTFAFLVMDAYCQKHKEDRVQTSLGLSYFNQSYHHLEDYQLNSPFLKMEEFVRWRNVIMDISTSHTLTEPSILRRGSAGLYYRNDKPFSDNWIETGIAFSYDKQDPENTESGKQSGWVARMKIHRKENHWYTHEANLNLGYHYGYVRDPKATYDSKYVLPEYAQTNLSYVRFGMGYTGIIKLPIFSIGGSLQYNKSNLKEDLLFSARLQKDIRLSYGQELQLFGGGTMIGIFHSSPIFQSQDHSEAVLFPKSDKLINPPTGNNHYVFLGFKNAILKRQETESFLIPAVRWSPSAHLTHIIN